MPMTVLLLTQRHLVHSQVVHGMLTRVKHVSCCCLSLVFHNANTSAGVGEWGRGGGGGAGIHVKSIIINDFSRVNPAAPGPPISYRHWTVNGLLLVFSYQADPYYIDTSSNFSIVTRAQVPPSDTPLPHAHIPRAPLSFSTIGISSTARRICSRIKGIVHVSQSETIYIAMWLHIVPGISCHNKKMRLPSWRRLCLL